MQRLRHLIVIIPGIGGSELSDSTGHKTWTVGISALTRLLIKPGALDEDHGGQLEPTALIRSFTTFGPLMNIVGYEGLSEILESNFRSPRSHVHRKGRPAPSDTDVLLFPYDFRRSIADSAVGLADAINQTLAGIHQSAQHDRVIVLAHSMGGLVARYWIGALGGWRVCKALFTLGTPHRGAPKAFDWLVNGPGVGPLKHTALTRVLRGWPSMYELLPQYPAIWSESEQRAIETDQIPPLLVQHRPRLKDYEEEFRRMSGRARDVHDDIAAAWQQIPAEHVPDLLPLFGRGHATANAMTLSPEGRLLITKDDPPWRGNVEWKGDGTVPMLSAVPRELGDVRSVWRGLPDRHGELASPIGLIDPLISYNGEALPTRGDEAPSTPWLGIDIEDVVPAGVDTPIGVGVQPSGTLAERVQVTVSAAARPGQALFSSPMTWNEARRKWQCTLPGFSAGHYKVSMEAMRVGGPESVFAAVDLVALDPDYAFGPGTRP
jgi:hypothetical protein